jgi:predicted PurR-regulated permease PerM
MGCRPEFMMASLKSQSIAATASSADPSHAHVATTWPSEQAETVEPVRVASGGLALSVLAIIAFIFALQWARDFFIPLVFGILVAYTLNPLVGWLERIRVPRMLGASLVMLAIVGGTAGVATSVYNEAQSIIDELPFAAYKFTNAVKRMDDGQAGPLTKLRNFAEALKKAASPADPPPAESSSGASPSPPASPAPAVVMKPSEFNLSDWLLAGSMGVAAFAGKLIMVLFLVFFALLSGNTFKRKLVKMTGPSLSNKKITVQILDDINRSIQGYMFMLLTTNVILGVVTWLALHAIGLDNPGAWAVAAALLHVIPYFGSAIAAAAIGFAAFLQFESFSMLFLAVAVVLGVATLVGTLITTWMTGRIAKMNATAVFVALLFGGWLWGVWGMLLCVPIVVVVKVVSEHIEGMQSLAELLGE